MLKPAPGYPNKAALQAKAAPGVSLDRVSVPMEEPRPRPRGRPKAKAPKRPVTRAFRMAYVGTVTLHDKEGQALKTLRYGRMPQGDAKQLAQRMAQDVQQVLGQRFMPVVVLTDGSPEMMNLLDQALASHAEASLHPSIEPTVPARAAHRLVLEAVLAALLEEELVHQPLKLVPPGGPAINQLGQGWKNHAHTLRNTTIQAHGGSPSDVRRIGSMAG